MRYRVDAGQSQFTVQAAATGLLSVIGHSPTIAVCGLGGDVRFPPGAMEAASLLILVRADSLKVIGSVGDDDRREMERAMREEVLKCATYPEIVFVSQNNTTRRVADQKHMVTINGRLTLHGVTRHCPVPAEVTLSEESIRARGEFSLRQSDYNIKLVSAAAGMLTIKDELKLMFDISAIPH